MGLGGSPVNAGTNSDGIFTVSIPDYEFPSLNCRNIPGTITATGLEPGDYWSATVEGFNRNYRQGSGVSDYAYGDGSGTWRLDLFACPRLDGFGTYEFDVSVELEDVTTELDGSTFTQTTTSNLSLTARVRGKVRITANVSPEPVRKGSTIKVLGKLRDAYGLGAKCAKNVYARIQFKAANSTSWNQIGRARCPSGGNTYTFRTKAKKSGAYRAVYVGSRVYAPRASAGDFVRVRS
jgi:hypothetical protein